MAFITLMQNNFTSGEISPRLEGRPDIPRYQTGLRRALNVIPLRQGPFTKRPGTIFSSRTKGDQTARLIAFEASDGTPYLFEFTPLALRIYTAAGVQYGSDLTTPYAAADLAGLKWAVNKGSMWIAHPSYAVRKVTFSAGSFSISTPTFTGDRTFSASGEYPRGICFHQGRLVLMGCDNRPDEICLSRPPDASTGADRYTDFDLDTNNDGTIVASDAIILQKSDQGPVALRWGVSHLRMVLASSRLVAMDNGELATPSGFDYQTCLRGHPLDIQGELAEQFVLYLGAGPSLHALYFSSDDGGYLNVEVTKDADHILQPSVVGLAVMSAPAPIAWVVRSDGLVASVSIDGTAGIMAPALQDLSGIVESAAAIPGDRSDTLWLCINRDGKHCLESLTIPHPYALELEDEHYVDSGIVYSGSATTTISGLGHLEGKTVSILADGKIQAPKTVASGSITLDKAASKVHVGLPIHSEAETLRAEVPANGTSQGKKRRIDEVTLRLFRSLGGSVAVSGKASTPLLYLTAGEYIYGSALDPFTGDKKKSINGGLDADTTLVISHDEPCPFTVLAIIYKVALLEA
ncbi:MAG TPA: hypothetical protein PLB91_06940 [Spirochaetales bacterium]|nr:hypothetical protein [Spirochaetales bacterium]HRY52998.1 hypothetical protein [Spirochaetia bacterium]